MRNTSLNESIRIINERISGKRALYNVDGITKYHRIQASQGYRDAAVYCKEILEKEGIPAQIEAYPANEHTKYWTQQMFKEWNCQDARLKLVSPEPLMLADFREDPLSIVQRSAACDFWNRPVEVMLIEKGKRECYESEELEGKLLFVSEDPTVYAEWAAQKNALGLITDYMSDIFVRQRGDRYDDRLFLSFNWMNEEKDQKIPAFILTPRMGDRLRTLCMQMEQAYREGKAEVRFPTVRGYIDAEFKDGTIEDVTAVIPGETEEEVLILAHLCHAKACANDNASGCGGALEVMRVLNELIQEQKLQRPKRGIRMLLVPEVVGTYAYLASDESRIEKIMAGIDVDMIGRRQEGKCGLVGMMGVPDSTASFVQDLAAYVVDENSRDAATFNIDEYVTPVHIKQLDYVGGSDHYVLCDPTVGIPCMIMMQWLDSNYHSSADRVNQLDPNVLQKNCSIAAAYLYILANLQVEDLPLLMNKGRERRIGKLLKTIREQYGKSRDYASTTELLQYQKEVGMRSLEDYRRFFSGEEQVRANCLIEWEKEYLSHYAEELIEDCRRLELEGFCKEHCSEVQKNTEAKTLREIQGKEELPAAYLQVPRRLMKGPITFVGFANGLSAPLKEKYDYLKQSYPDFYGINSMNDFILHRVDGKRNIYEIAKGAAIEGRLYSPEYVLHYLEFLSEAGLVSFLG